MRILILLFFLIFCSQSSAQRNDTDFAIYNILSGTVIGGVGAIINKHPNETFWKTLWRGSSQGAIGGYLNFESKRLIRNFTQKQDYRLVWPSRLVNAAGNSIIMNGASNLNFGQSWHFNLAFIHLQYNSTESKQFKTRLMPFSMISAVIGFATESFDGSKSVKTGLLIFETQEQLEGEALGYNKVNTVFYFQELNRKDLYDTIGHEILHGYQYNGSMPTNAFYNQTALNFENNGNKFFQFYNKYFYSDFNYLLNFSVSGIERLAGTDPRERLIEIEPYYFAEGLQFR